MQHTHTFWTVVAVLVAVATTVTWWVVRRARVRDERHIVDVRSLESWEAQRRALAPRDSGAATVGHALGVVLMLGLLVAALAVAGGLETAGL